MHRPFAARFRLGGGVEQVLAYGQKLMFAHALKGAAQIIDAGVEPLGADHGSPDCRAHLRLLL